MIHLDSHIIKKPLKEERWGLIDAAHRKGIEMYPAFAEALKTITTCMEGEEYHFQVTPGGFFAMEHLLLNFYLEEVRHTGKNHFITSLIEEAPLLKSLDRMEMLGCGVKLLPVDLNGIIDIQVLEEAIRPKTSLLSFSAVCALTGVMQPVPEIIALCQAKGVKVHINASHAIGTWGVSLKEWDADYLTFDGDKIGTTQGVGGVFSKEPLKEGMQNIFPLAEAVKTVTDQQASFAMETARLRAEFEAELTRAIPDCQIIGQDVARVPHIFAVSFPGLMSEALLHALYRQNIEASIGGGQFQTLYSILKQSGHPEEIAFGAISFCITPEEDLAYALDKLVTSVRKLKKMSAAL